MSQGTYACHADIVTDEFVREICQEEIRELDIALAASDYSLEGLGVCNDSGDFEGEINGDLDEDSVAIIIASYKNLCKVFQEKTGLSLNIKYHNKEDKGDEVDGMFWEVDGVYILSEAGEKYKDKIERKAWTVYG